MIRPSSCPWWQPDTATKPAEEHRSYTTSWDTIRQDRHSSIFLPANGLASREREGAGTHRRRARNAKLRGELNPAFVGLLSRLPQRRSRRFMRGPRDPNKASWLVGALVGLLQLWATPLLAREAASASRESAPAASTPTRGHLRPIVNGRRMQPRRDDMCSLLHRSSDCRDGNANGVDDDLLREILSRAAP